MNNSSINPIPRAPNWSRRDFLKVAAAGSAAALTSTALAARQATQSAPGKLVDVNVTLSQWPMRRLPLDSPGLLAAKLRKQGVTRAWASSFEGLLHKDLASVNARLAETCLHERIFVPFGVVNPMLPNWAEDLVRCQDQHRMPGIRLYPNYHGYKLDDPVFEEVLSLASSRRMVVQIALCMEDERMQHPFMRVKPVDPAPLVSLVRRFPALNILLLNWAKNLRPALASTLAKSGQVYFDIAMVEGVGGIMSLLNSIPAGRLLFGSHAPFFYFEAAALKLRESILSLENLEAISRANAASLMASH